MTATATKTKPELWRAWLQPPVKSDVVIDEITRDDALRRIQENGFDFTDNNFTYWVNIGLLPRSERRRHEGRTQGFYPVSIVPTVIELIALRRNGATVDELKDQARDIFTRATLVRADERVNELLKGYANAVLAERLEAERLEAARVETDLIDDHLGEALRNWTQRRKATTGADAAHIEVNVIDRDGKTSGFRIKINSYDDWEISTRLSRRSRSESSQD